MNVEYVKNVQFWILYRIPLITQFRAKVDFGPFGNELFISVHLWLSTVENIPILRRIIKVNNMNAQITFLTSFFDTLCSYEQGWLHEEGQLPTSYYLHRKKKRKKVQRKKRRNGRRKRKKKKREKEEKMKRQIRRRERSL